jgi:hypothetical protein
MQRFLSKGCRRQVYATMKRSTQQLSPAVFYCKEHYLFAVSSRIIFANPYAALM